MTMRLKMTVALAVAAVVMAAAAAQGTIRINGNQLMSAAIDYDAPSALRAGSPALAGSPRLIVSFGQGIMGRGTIPNMTPRRPAASSYIQKIGIGLSYDIVNVALGGYGACPVALTGDADLSGTITSGDVIALVGFVFKGGAAPLPCAAAGDVNCDGSVSSADLIYLVGHVFKGGPAPCDVCILVPSEWSCP